MFCDIVCKDNDYFFYRIASILHIFMFDLSVSIEILLFVQSIQQFTETFLVVFWSKKLLKVVVEIFYLAASLTVGETLIG